MPIPFVPEHHPDPPLRSFLHSVLHRPRSFVVFDIDSSIRKTRVYRLGGECVVGPMWEVERAKRTVVAAMWRVAPLVSGMILLFMNCRTCLSSSQHVKATRKNACIKEINAPVRV